MDRPNKFDAVGTPGYQQQPQQQQQNQQQQQQRPQAPPPVPLHAQQYTSHQPVYMQPPAPMYPHQPGQPQYVYVQPQYYSLASGVDNLLSDTGRSLNRFLNSTSYRPQPQLVYYQPQQYYYPQQPQQPMPAQYAGIPQYQSNTPPQTPERALDSPALNRSGSQGSHGGIRFQPVNHRRMFGPAPVDEKAASGLFTVPTPTARRDGVGQEPAPPEMENTQNAWQAQSKEEEAGEENAKGEKDGAKVDQPPPYMG
ncbi:hypothetical protein BC829DRAFT_396191 [Chytridium lagenaria]|nr:hypothetical protein BC829DRAFT_396191 [Chytridium lagenaria]